jgi:hypothetical protein
MAVFIGECGVLVRGKAEVGKVVVRQGSVVLAWCVALASPMALSCLPAKKKEEPVGTFLRFG